MKVKKRIGRILIEPFHRIMVHNYVQIHTDTQTWDKANADLILSINLIQMWQRRFGTGLAIKYCVYVIWTGFYD